MAEEVTVNDLVEMGWYHRGQVIRLSDEGTLGKNDL